MKNKYFLVLFTTLVLAGFGCSPTIPASDTAAKDTAEAVDFQSGSTVTIKQTVFGLGGIFAETVSGDGLAEYQLVVDSFVPENFVSFSWSNKVEVETADSIAVREAFEAASHPIGDTTKAPTPVYETVTKTGNYSTTALDNGTKILLPAYWSEGDQSFEDNSIIWLSKEQYESLVSTKTATLSLGLFDEKIASLVGMSDSVQNALNTLQQKAADASKSQDIYKLTADNDWQTYSLLVDGTEKTVQTIQANNWFGSYVILANAENPLVLKATLNPFALGSFNISSPLSSFLGYEVTEIKIK
ncbi:MAG: hypothetical protein V1716_03860 [Candidatus Uhrbacteria bacterium]